jgi:UDP-N-acetylglucosamine 3-dehydrogenase
MNVAVIGVGQMGRTHARTYAGMKDVSLVAVSDINVQLGEKIAREFKTKFYKDYKQMLQMEKIDAVSICVPTKFHYEVAKYTINNKLNTLLEKPITMDVKEGYNLLAMAKKNRVKFLVGHIERFNPAVIKVKEMIAAKELGEVIAIMSRRVGGFPPQIDDANIAVDLSIHDIDIVNYLLNDKPKKVYVNKQKNHITKREDSVEFFLKYKKASAFLQANWVTPVKIRKLNITGKEGYLEMDYITQEITYYKSNYRKFKKRYKTFSDYVLEFSKPKKTTVLVEKKEPLKEEIAYFLNCIKENIRINSQFAVEALEIALTSN